MESSEDYIKNIINETVRSKEKVKLFKKNKVFYLVMNSGMNTISWEFAKAIEGVVDDLNENHGDLTNHSFVSLSTNLKIYSNGMDLPSVTSEEDLGNLFKYAGKVLAKLLGLGMPTIAMVSGHAFAAGLYIALSHDYIIMKKEKGYLCFNEMLFGAPVHRYNTVFSKAKIGTKNYFEMYMHSLKVDSEEGYRRGIVHKFVPGEEINKVTKEFAEEIQSINTDSEAFSMMKHDIYREVIHSLKNDPGINDYAVKKVFAFKNMMAKL